MARLITWATVAATMAACSSLQASNDPHAPNQCFAESGYLDSTNGCSARAGYPDCYLVCPEQGTRKHL